MSGVELGLIYGLWEVFFPQGLQLMSGLVGHCSMVSSGSHPGLQFGVYVCRWPRIRLQRWFRGLGNRLLVTAT